MACKGCGGVGAYFSPTGAEIQQGAGEYVENMPWAGAAHDGSLGNLSYGAPTYGPVGPGMPLPPMPRGGFAPRKVVTRSRSVPIAPQFSSQAAGVGEYVESMPWAGSYQDGLFGAGSGMNESYPGELQTYQDGSLGSLGGDTADGRITSYGDGILGIPEFAASGDDPVNAYGDGVLGTPAYASAPQFDYGMLNGLGAASAGVVLDLTKPAVMKEMKAALAISGPALGVASGAGDKYTAEWYDDPLWDAKATELLIAWMQWYDTDIAKPGSGVAGSPELVVNQPGGTYPNPKGVAAILSMGVGSAGYPGGAGYFQTNFPNLYAWMQAMQASQFDYASAAVTKPFFTARDQAQASSGGMKMSTMALIGLGVVGVLGAVVVFVGRRKR
jgi:hypothetical protein